MQVQSLGQEDPLKKEMAIYPHIFAWEIPWTEEPGGLQPMGSQKSDIATKLPPSPQQQIMGIVKSNTRRWTMTKEGLR